MYKILFRIAAAVVGLIGCVLLVAPKLYLGLYAITYDASMDFPSQRFAPVLIGVAGMLSVLSSQPPSPVLSRICLIAAFVLFAVALTGAYHFAQGVAGVSVLVAAASEVGLGLALLLAQKSARGS